MPNFFVDSNKQKAANEALARGEKDFMKVGLRAPASQSQNKKGNKRKFGSLRYPNAQLTDDSDFLEIKVVEYKPPGFSRSQDQALKMRTSSEVLKKNIENPLGTIFLPVPSTIQDSAGVEWGSSEINGLAATGLSLATDFIENKDLMNAGKELMDGGVEAGKSLVQDPNLVGALNARFGSAVVNALGGNIDGTGVFFRSTGTALNPNMELLFKSVQLRNFTFTFNLTPRDKKESETIKKMIRIFKRSIHAKNGSGGDNPSSGLFISSPDVFQLSYKSGRKNHPFLHRFKPMAMTGFDVNYTNTGQYTTYEDGTPTYLSFDMSFQELNPIYSEDYESEEGLEGVGF